MEGSLTKLIGKGTFWSSVGTVLIKFVGIGTIALILFRLSAFEYGLVELALSVVPLLSIFLLPGLYNTVVADMGVEKSRGNISAMKSIFLNFSFAQLFFAVIAWAIVFFGSDIISSIYYKSDIGSLLKLVSFAFLLSPLRTIIGVLISVYLRFLTQSLYSLFEEFSKFCTIAVLFFIFDLRIEAVVLAVIISQLLTVVMFLPLAFSLYKKFGYAHYRISNPFSVFNFHGKWSVLSTYADSFGKNVRLWIIQYFLGAEVVGYFAVAQGFIGHLLSLVPVSKVVVPILPQLLDQKEKFYSLIGKTLKYQVLSSVFLGVLAFFLLPFLLMWVFPKYVGAIPFIKLMLLVVIPSSFSVFTATFFTLKRQKNLFFATMTRPIYTALTLPILITFFGVPGLIFEYLSINYLFVIERYLVLKRLMPGFHLSVRDFVTVDSYDKYIISSLFKSQSKKIARARRFFYD